MTKEQKIKEIERIKGSSREQLTNAGKIIYDMSFDEDYKAHMPYETGKNGGNDVRGNNNIHKLINLEKIYKGNEIIELRSLGLAPENSGLASSNIPQNVRKNLKGAPCVFLGIYAEKMEVDHKIGARLFQQPDDLKLKNEEYFQSVSKAANDAKRQKCKKCQEIKKRFDARDLGFKVGWTYGDENLNVTDGEKFSFEKNPCKGCYYYDPIEFRNNL